MDYLSRYNQRLQEVEASVQRTREINSVLRDVGFATDTCFWSTDVDGMISEVSNDALLGTDLSAELLGRDILSLFESSPERDLFRARMARGSEIVALELEVQARFEIDSLTADLNFYHSNKGELNMREEEYVIGHFYLQHKVTNTYIQILFVSE